MIQVIMRKSHFYKKSGRDALVNISIGTKAKENDHERKVNVTDYANQILKALNGGWYLL